MCLHPWQRMVPCAQCRLRLRHHSEYACILQGALRCLIIAGQRITFVLTDTRPDLWPYRTSRRRSGKQQSNRRDGPVPMHGNADRCYKSVFCVTTARQTTIATSLTRLRTRRRCVRLLWLCVRAYGSRPRSRSGSLSQTRWDFHGTSSPDMECLVLTTTLTIHLSGVLVTPDDK